MADLKTSWSSDSSKIVEFRDLPDLSFFRFADGASRAIYYKLTHTVSKRTWDTLGITFTGATYQTSPTRLCIEVVQMEEAKFVDGQGKEE